MVSEAYAADHIEQAAAEGRIEVWYQPVIRSLSGQLCSFEALARWRDETYGMISPGIFVPALEKCRKIHILDSFMIRSICRLLHEELSEGRPIVPVSFNLSQLDFELCDIIGVLEEASEQYDIPRSCLHVEITESVMTDDSEKMHSRMDRLRADGFEIWMDDFGSGFSSLNVLKDFDFDLLKLDMKFLSDFSARSKSILSSIIRMSKEIGVHTLAEGVEDPQQLAFLKEAGCERIQGYLFGRPAPYREAVRSIEAQGILMEARQDVYFWSRIGEVDLQTELPAAILADDGTELVPVFVTRQNRQEIRSLGIEGEDAEYRFFNDRKNRTAVQMNTFLRLLPDDGKTYSLYVQDRENYLRLNARILVKDKGRRGYYLVLSNITESEQNRNLDNMERLLRNTYQLFSYITLLKVKANRARILYGCTPSGYSDSSPEIRHSLAEMRRWIADTQIYPEDRDRFLRFSDPESMLSAVRSSPAGTSEGYFRMATKDGQYSWVEAVCVRVSEKDGEEEYLVFHRVLQREKLLQNQALFSGRDLDERHAKPASSDERGNGQVPVSAEAIWRSLIIGGSMNFFWKDDQRRFLGASRSFLEYYGIRDISMILGKTDEDMRWHVDNGPYRTDEIEVLKEGRYVVNSPGTCIIRGELHHIMATKLPVYEHGRIAGLVGYFIDAEQVRQEADRKFRIQNIDPVTGLNNVYGMLNTIRYYVDNYEKNHSDFAMIRFHLHGYQRLLQEHGQEGLDQVLREVGRRLHDEAGNDAVIAYYGAGDLLALIQTTQESEVTAYAKRIRSITESVRSVGGVTCTFYVNYDYVWYHDAGSFMEFHTMIDSIQLE